MIIVSSWRFRISGVDCSERTVCDNGGGGSKRQEIKALIKRLKRENPNIEKSIFNSLHSVCIETFPGFKAGGELHSFLEDYENREPQKG